MQNVSDPIQTDSARSTWFVVTRVLGILVLLIGLWVMLNVIGTAMKLFEDQSAVTKVADGIESRMHLNEFLRALVAYRMARQPGELETPEAAAALNKLQSTDLVFPLAWMAVLVLLSVIGKIGIRMVQSGGELALHNQWEIRQTRRLLQDLGRSIRGSS